MLNFYRKSLPGLKDESGRTITPAEILQPLYTAATSKMPRAKFTTYWEENNLKESFQKAKQMLKNCVTLTFPNANNPLALSCDASSEAIGSVLEELQDGVWKPLGYFSKHLTPAKKNWSIFRRELLSIQQSIRHFMPDIYGRELTVFSDHKAILGAMASKGAMGKI